MPKQITADSIWGDRIKSANDYYDKWAKLFKCEVMEKYYEGFQWKDVNNANDSPYTINKIFETVQIKLDEFIPAEPRFTVSPKVGNADWNQEFAIQSAQLKQDVLNTLISDDSAQFPEEVKAAYKDSFFRFGIVEAGYAADWVYNPRAQKPLLNTNVDPTARTENPKVKQEPEELPLNERVYFKHVPAKHFRVGGFDHKYLQRCSWCGYYEYVYYDDLMALPGLMNRDKVISGLARQDRRSVTTDTHDKKDSNMVKIYHIWDNKANVRLVILDNPCVTLFQRKLEFFNLFDFRHDTRVQVEGFYPVPPVWNWLSPQNEINETREQLRAHRRRFVRKFQVVSEMIDDNELEKFETGPDGSLITVKRENAITPIQNADLGVALDKAIVTSSDDLNQISGTSSELRGVADRTTATQANIINTRGSIRENAHRDQIKKWLCRIGRGTLIVARTKFSLGFWAQLTQDPGEQIFGTMQETQQIYQWVTSEDLKDGYDFKIDMDVTTLSAQTQDIESKKFFQFLAVVNQFPQIAMSPTLIREAAYRCGYRNEKVIREMQQMALVHQLGMMQGIAGAQPAGNASQQIVAQQTPNNLEQIRQQIGNQQLTQ